MKATLNDLLNAKGVSEPLREAVKALIGRLEAAEKELESWKGLAQQLGNEVGRLCNAESYATRFRRFENLCQHHCATARSRTHSRSVFCPPRSACFTD